MAPSEVDRRYGPVREAMALDALDAVIVSGNEYTGFEGAVTYMSGFVIVHRYAYVLLPLEGEPLLIVTPGWDRARMAERTECEGEIARPEDHHRPARPEFGRANTSSALRRQCRA